MKCLLFHFCTWECLGTLQSYIETSKKPKKGQKLLENILKLQCGKKKISGPTCITLENMLPKSSRQRISGGHTKLSFSHISFRIKGKPENTCGTNMCDKRFQEKRPPQLQKAHCLKMTQKSLIFCNMASEASYVYSLISEIQLFVYMFETPMSAVRLHF